MPFAGAGKSRSFATLRMTIPEKITIAEKAGLTGEDVLAPSFDEMRCGRDALTTAGETPALHVGMPALNVGRGRPWLHRSVKRG